MATYFVLTNGNDSNTGTVNTSGGAFLTLSKAHSVSVAGDIIRVGAGTYNEQLTISRSGSSGNFITYVATGTVICRGFEISGCHHIRIVGFEITHTDVVSFTDAVRLSGTVDSIELWDLNIHNIHAIHGGIICLSGSTPVPTNIKIRSCTITDMGVVGATVSDGPSVGISSAFLTAAHWLVEYCTLARTGDFTNIYGSHVIVRNCYMHDFANSTWGTTDSFHSDMFQPGSDTVSVGTSFHVYEANFMGDSTESNSHVALFQDTVAAGDTNIMMRGNVAFNFGSGGVGVISTKKVLTYNNSFFSINTKSASSPIFIWYNPGGNTDISTGNLVVNSILSGAGSGGSGFEIDGSNVVTKNHNIGFQAGSDASYISTSDPLFVNTTTRNFRLQSGSAGRDAGTGVTTITSSSGSGNSFTVAESGVLCDGYGLVDGDTITINGTTTLVTAISGSTVTVADTVTWTNGMAVYWGSDSTPDLGALPYTSTELTAASLTSVGTTYTVTPTGDCRGVWFYVDGIPTTWVSQAPFSATIASGTVTAKSYARYAQASPVVTASAGTSPSQKFTMSGSARISGLATVT